MLMQHATAVKTETTGVDISSGKNLRRPFFWDLRSVSHPSPIDHGLY